MPDTSSGQEYGIRPLDYKVPIKMKIDTEMEAQYRVTACEKEPWTVEFIEAQPPGSWFIDVGANVGSYTLVAIAHGLRAFAIEPSIDNVYKLHQNLRLNDWADRAIVYYGAFADKIGFEHFSLANLQPGFNDHVYGKHKNQLPKRPDIFHTHVVPVVRIDDIVPILAQAGVPISMKIDVDGGEAMVLSGAVNSLKDSPLHTMLIELQRSHSEAVLGKLTELGWKETGRIDETTFTDKTYGNKRFQDMFYVKLDRA